jgi:Family of unknown function (DUF5641)
VERLVGVVKRTLAGALAQEVSANFDDEEFKSLATKCEGIINSRPLTFVSSESGDLTPITPRQFLLPTAAEELPPIPDDCQSPMLARLRAIDNVLTTVWDRFVTEYLPTLNKTQRWQRKRANFHIGDIVLSLEKGPVHRGRFPLARVTAIIPDQDGIVRHVIVKIGYKNPQKRHVQSLVRLFAFDDPRITGRNEKDNAEGTEIGHCNFAMLAKICQDVERQHVRENIIHNSQDLVLQRKKVTTKMNANQPEQFIPELSSINEDEEEEVDPTGLIANIPSEASPVSMSPEASIAGEAQPSH